ncbi:MAG: hypothetical protein H0X24_12570 [Ktedonobacterales bacterium]|nr:hypothetical protein [Ktedonobacterales bacterium]
MPTPPRRPGRPRKAKSERIMPRSIQRRLFWEPGEPHPLDVMFGRAGDAQVHLEQTIDRLVDQLVVLARGLRSSDEVATGEERAARQALRQRFSTRKHYDHLEVTLAAIRRRRLAARFAVISAALDLAQDLLGEPGLSPEEELVALLAEEESHTKRRRAASTEALADRLAAFERQLQAQRADLLRGAGNFEYHYVRKLVLNRAALREAKQMGRKVALDELYIERRYGPYLDYRWREGKGPLYTVHLGRFDEAVEGFPTDASEPY